MNYMDDASTFERSLLQKARQKHIPVTGALELLPLCNMNCDMCYVRLSRSEMERQGRLRTVEEWVRLAEQMQKAGTVFLLLTGGEPLLFPDFKTLLSGPESESRRAVPVCTGGAGWRTAPRMSSARRAFPDTEPPHGRKYV